MPRLGLIFLYLASAGGCNAWGCANGRYPVGRVERRLRSQVTRRRVADFHRIQGIELMLAGCFEGFIEKRQYAHPAGIVTRYSTWPSTKGRFPS